MTWLTPFFLLDFNVQHASDAFNDEGNLVEEDEFGGDEDFADQDTLEGQWRC